MEIVKAEERLAICEQQINDSFYNIGKALLEIRDDELYLAAGDKSFAQYCERRWGYSRQRAYQLIDSSQVYKKLSTVVDNLPKTERQTRALDKEHPAEHWTQAQQETGKEQPTSRELEEHNPFSKSAQLNRSKPGTKTTASTGGSFGSGPSLDSDMNQDYESAAPGFRLHVLCPPDDQRRIERAFNDPEWLGRFLAACAGLSTWELEEMVGLNLPVEMPEWAN